jgi:apolipoprotein N-acyltransferase
MGTASSVARPGRRVLPLKPQPITAAPRPWWQSTWSLAIAGAVLLWAALPPLDLAPLAWLAPIPWVLLVRQQSLGGRRPYLKIYLVSIGFWLATFYWLTLPHWATSFGWVAISLYLALYIPAFVALARVAVQRLNVSPVLAAPVVWTGLELARAHLLSGVTMASIAHTQYRWPLVIQVSDLVGNYGVSFVIVLVGAAMARMIPWDGAPRAWWPALPAAAVLGATLAYGQLRTTEETTVAGPTIGLIQGSIDIEMKHDPTQSQRIFDEYFELSRRAVREHPEVDLLVWPETMFRYPWFTFAEDFVAEPDTISAAEATSRSHRAVENTVLPLGKPLILGIDTVHGTRSGVERYNSALFLDPQARELGRYDKVHPVMFGEYVPLGKTFPWLYRLTPLPTGLDAGTRPVSVTIGQARYSANICYEDTVPHLIAAQVRALATENAEPDVLVNLTNDGWFWGSTELDLHLANAVFRAVECRKPLVIAANTGFSASIDSCGRILAQGPRRDSDIVIAPVRLDRRSSVYLAWGDLPAGVCLAAVCALAIVGIRDWRKRGQTLQSATV